ncbi:hypothetical protein AB0F73_25065 [Micromonospora purpureochromogenes]|uniref:hypothetical protein n=1 Tax=Micromonospora purpureochromogenes TaxID=47872 RepID=UPI0033C05287
MRELDDPRVGRVLAALLAMQRQSWEQGVTGHALLDLGLDQQAVLLADAAVTRRPGTSPEAQAFHLLAYAALRRAG